MPASPFALPRPQRPAALVLCVLLAGCAGQAREAMPSATPGAATTSASPIDADAALARGEQAYRREDWDTAEREFLAAAQALREDAEPWFKLGNVYVRTARYDIAAQAYEQCLRRAPGHAKAWHNLGVVRLHQADRSFERVSEAPEPHDAALDARARRMRELLEDAIEPAPGAP